MFLELVLMMERVFAGKISSADELTIKYLDDDGDKITLSNDSDLTVALHFHKLLRLFVFVNGQEPLATDSLHQEGNFVDAKTYRNELQEIRNSVQTILDRLQLTTNEVSPPPTTTTVPQTTVAPNTGREFDPLKHAQQQTSAAAPENTQSNSNGLASNEHQMTASKGIEKDFLIKITILLEFSGDAPRAISRSQSNATSCISTNTNAHTAFCSIGIHE